MQRLSVIRVPVESPIFLGTVHIILLVHFSSANVFSVVVFVVVVFMNYIFHSDACTRSRCDCIAL